MLEQDTIFHREPGIPGKANLFSGPLQLLIQYHASLEERVGNICGAILLGRINLNTKRKVQYDHEHDIL